MKRKQPEAFIQKTVAEHLRLRAKPGVVWWHCPNGGKRHPREAKRFKEMGVLAGVSDIIAVHNGEIFALELKAEKNGKVSDAQRKFIFEMSEAGAFTCIAEGLNEALACLEAWGLVDGWVG